MHASFLMAWSLRSGEVELLEYSLLAMNEYVIGQQVNLLANGSLFSTPVDRLANNAKY